MPFQKGNPGRPKGATNRLSRDVKAAITKALEDSAPELTKWLASVGQTEPARAADIYAKLAEFTTPKLGRQELTGADGAPLQVTVQTLADRED